MSEQRTEIEGLRNIVQSTLAHPDAIRLAVAGCFLEDDPQAALESLAKAVAEVEPS